MRVLALETSTLRPSVAAVSGERLLSTEPVEGRAAKSLAPTIERVLAATGWRPSDVELVAVDVGPGSFTGQRVGVTTAKAFAYAAGADVLAVDSLTVIAEQVPGEPAIVSAVLDAQRGELFEGRFERGDDGVLVQHGEPRIVAVDAWLAELKAPAIVSGEGLMKMLSARQRGAEQQGADAFRSPLMADGVEVADEKVWTPRAETVARIAQRLHEAGRRDDLWKLSPLYLRKSYAEE